MIIKIYIKRILSKNIKWNGSYIEWEFMQNGSFISVEPIFNLGNGLTMKYEWYETR